MNNKMIDRLVQEADHTECSTTLDKYLTDITIQGCETVVRRIIKEPFKMLMIKEILKPNKEKESKDE